MRLRETGINVYQMVIKDSYKLKELSECEDETDRIKAAKMRKGISDDSNGTKNVENE